MLELHTLTPRRYAAVHGGDSLNGDRNGAGAALRRSYFARGPRCAMGGVVWWGVVWCDGVWCGVVGCGVV